MKERISDILTPEEIKAQHDAAKRKILQVMIDSLRADQLDFVMNSVAMEYPDTIISIVLKDWDINNG